MPVYLMFDIEFLTRLSLFSVLWCYIASFKAAKASAKWEDDENWSKETDYF